MTLLYTTRPGQWALHNTDKKNPDTSVRMRCFDGNYSTHISCVTFSLNSYFTEITFDTLSISPPLFYGKSHIRIVLNCSNFFGYKTCFIHENVWGNFQKVYLPHHLIRSKMHLHTRYAINYYLGNGAEMKYIHHAFKSN